jgi:hypothetical protein
MSDFLSDVDPKNLANELREVKRRLLALEQRPLRADTLDQLAPDLGTLRQGELLSADSGQPDDGDYTGLFWSHQGYIFTLNGIDYTLNLAGLLNGLLQFGLSAEDGSGIFAGGDGIIDQEGVNLNGIRYALRHYATDPDGNNARYGRFEMFYEDGKTIPGLALTFMDGATGTNLVANGNFETGDLTNWTLGTHQTPGPVVAAGAAYPGTVYGIDCTWTIPASPGYLHNYIDSDRCAVGSLTNYSLTFTCRKVQDVLNGWKYLSSLLRCSVYIKWYDDPTAGSLLRTDSIGGTLSSTWGILTYNVTSPVGAASVVVEVDIYSYQVYDFEGRYSSGTAQVYFDEVTLTQILFSRKLLFGPDPSIYDGSTTRKILGGVKELSLPRAPTISLVTTASGNCDNGAHNVKITFVDSEGETLPGTVSNSVTVDASHKQITVPLPIGPWGTTGRNIYMTAVADQTTWLLAATIADNTTTTTNLSISDANLAAAVAAPGYNTTGSRPLFPRSAVKLAQEFLLFKAAGNSKAMTMINNGSQVQFGFYVKASSGANLDRWQTQMYLEAGTYNFLWHGYEYTAAGIFDLWVDGVVVATGFDTYGSGNYDSEFTMSSITVVGSGYHLIELVLNDKNGSSSGYNLATTYIEAKQVKY